MDRRSDVIELASVRSRRAEEPLWGWLIAATLGVLAVAATPAVIGYLLVGSVGIDGASLLSSDWRPTAGEFGLGALVVGTLLTSALAMALALPLGLGAVIALRFYAPPTMRALGESALGILAGIPSVVFGLFGTVWLVPTLGPSLASAALVLAMMIIPTFSLLALAALRQLPVGLVEAGAALGVERVHVVTRLAMRSAFPALLAAAAFALARALGEALAVEMVCGNVAGIPSGLLEPVRTLTTTLVQEFDYAAGTHRQALYVAALSVVILASLASAMGIRLATRRKR